MKINETAQAMRHSARKFDDRAWRYTLKAREMRAEADRLDPPKRSKDPTRLCPRHGIPDCSPLLNGCSELTAGPARMGADRG